MSRYIIWFAAIAGVLPVGVLSFLCLQSHALFARADNWAADPESVSIASRAVIIGPGGAEIQISAKIWPAISVICGIALVFLGMFFLIPQQSHRAHRNGVAKIGDYVARVLGSQSEHASVVITTEDHAHSVAIARRGERVLVSVVSSSVNVNAPRYENRIRELLVSQGGAWESGLYCRHPVVEGEACVLQLATSRNSQGVAELIRTLFLEVLGVEPSCALTFAVT